MVNFGQKSKAWLKGYITSSREEISELKSQIQAVEESIAEAEKALSQKSTRATLKEEVIRDAARKLGEFTVRELAAEADMQERSVYNVLNRMMERNPDAIVFVARRQVGVGRPTNVYRYQRPTGSSAPRRREEPIERQVAREFRSRSSHRGGGQARKRTYPKTQDKGLNDMLRIAFRSDWRIEKRGDHIRAYAPNGVDIVTVPLTPSDWRSAENTRADFRRAGLDFGDR